MISRLQQQQVCAVRTLLTKNVAVAFARRRIAMFLLSHGRRFLFVARCHRDPSLVIRRLTVNGRPHWCSSAFNRRHSAPADAATQFYALFGLSRLSGPILVSIGVISTRFSQISCQLSLSPYITRHSHQLIPTVVPRLSVLSISKHAREVNGHTRRSTCLELAVSRGIWRCTIQIRCQLMGGWRLTPPPPEPSSSPPATFSVSFFIWFSAHYTGWTAKHQLPNVTGWSTTPLCASWIFSNYFSSQKV